MDIADFLTERYDEIDSALDDQLEPAAQLERTMQRRRPDEVGGIQAEQMRKHLKAWRAILALHPSEIIGGDDWNRGAYVSCKTCDGEPYPCQTLKLMASPFTDHPHYRQARLAY